MASLQRAVPLAEDEYAALPVAEDLDLDVTTALDERLDEHGAVTEGRLGLLAGLGDLTGERGEVPDDAHAAATAAGGRLDEQRGRSASVAVSGDVTGRRTGTPAASISFLDSIFEPICSIDSGEGPIHVRPAASTARAKSAFSDRKP